VRLNYPKRNLKANTWKICLSPDGSIFKDKEEESESELTPLPLIEEILNVSKNEVICREAKLIKEPIIETETVEVPVTYEDLIVERRPASKRAYSTHIKKSSPITYEKKK
jgi:stress response protein YsnF